MQVISKTATDKQIGARLQVIIDTNVKMAYGKGNYNRLMLVKDKKPYWIYHQVERKTKRAEHSIYNGRKFHCDDPIWNTIYPPSGFRCSCWVEAVAEPDGVESGSNIEINPDEHPISPLSVWKPETGKYVEGIGKALEGILGKTVNKDTTEYIGKYIDYDDLECDLLRSQRFSNLAEAIHFAKGKKQNNAPCSGIVEGQPTWKDYNLSETINTDPNMEIPKTLDKIRDNDKAIDTIIEALTKGLDGSNIIKTAIEDRLMIDRDNIRHLIINNKGIRKDDHREQYANYMLPTLLDPDEVYNTLYWISSAKKYAEENPDAPFVTIFEERARYIKLFPLPDNKLFVLATTIDRETGNYIITGFPADAGRLNEYRVGKLLYSKQQQRHNE